MSKAKKSTVKVEQVADICLYGTSLTGAGWLAVTTREPSKPFGDHEPKPERSFSEAVWLAVAAISARMPAGRVRVFAPGGERFAWIDTRTHVPAFGSLSWCAVGGA